jgi:putative transposase
VKCVYAVRLALSIWSCMGTVMSCGAVPRQNSDLLSNQADKLCATPGVYPCKTGRMLRQLRLLFVTLARLFDSLRDLLLENLALRQQLGVLRRRHPQPRFAGSDRLFWAMLRRIWSGWKQALIIVRPETVVRWHRAGFKAYWTWLPRHRNRPGKKCVSRELRELIFRMVAEDGTCRAPQIHDELKMLGFKISERP